MRKLVHMFTMAHVVGILFDKPGRFWTRWVLGRALSWISMLGWQRRRTRSRSRPSSSTPRPSVVQHPNVRLVAAKRTLVRLVAAMAIGRLSHRAPATHTHQAFAFGDISAQPRTVDVRRRPSFRAGCFECGSPLSETMTAVFLAVASVHVDIKCSELLQTMCGRIC